MKSIYSDHKAQQVKVVKFQICHRLFPCCLLNMLCPLAAGREREKPVNIKTRIPPMQVLKTVNKRSQQL